MKRRKKTAQRTNASGKRKSGKRAKAIMPDKRTVLTYCVTGIIIALSIIIYTEYGKREKRTPSVPCDYCRQATAPIAARGTLDDSESLHYLHAKSNGTLHSDAIKLKNSRYYVVNIKTDETQPYAVPELKQLLDLLGMTFQNELAASGRPKYRFEITAAMSLPDSDCRTALYQYGATADIAAGTYLYRGKRITDKNADTALYNSLIKLRQECRCVVTMQSDSNGYVITAVKLKQ